MLLKLLVPLVAGVAYLAGLAVHELTHVVACKALGARIDTIQAYPPVVVYEAPNELTDKIIRSSTVAACLLMLVAYGLHASESGMSLYGHLVVLAFLAGYLPRSGSDWAPILKGVPT